MASHDCGISWFLAQLKLNCADIAEKNLRRQGFKSFLPLEEQTRLHNGKFITDMQPLFPG
jgi:transcriptional antiterminator RfaH